MATTEYGAYSSPIYINSDRGEYFLQYDGNNYRVCLQNNAENSIVIAAAKLELGAFSTLTNEVVGLCCRVKEMPEIFASNTCV